MSYDRKLKCGVFIDGSNVIWGSLNMPHETRWFVDYAKLKNYLKDMYRPQFYKYYGATDDQPKKEPYITRAVREKKMYSRLVGLGYDVITKPLKYIKKADGNYTTKGDMDIELSLDVVDSLNDLDTVVLFGGDCDYLPLINRLHAAGKYIRIYSFKGLLSWELRTFCMQNTRCSYKILDEIEDIIRYEKVLTS